MQRIINLIKSVTRLSCKSAEQWENDYFGCKVTALGQATSSEILYPYGLKANPPTGTRNLSLSLNANMCNTISVPMMPASDGVPKAGEGDVIFGNPESGSYILMTKSGGLKIVGDVEIQGKMNVSDDVELKGKLDVTDDVTATDCKTTGGISLKDHQHTQPLPTGGTGSYVDGNSIACQGASGPPAVIP